MARPDGDHRKVIESHNYHKAVQGYLASITYADAEIGRLIAALDKSPYADNTIVILWGDHGWHLGEKLHWRKFSLWEEADRAPLLLIAPRITEPGGKCPRTVSFMDIYPTLADLCGLEIPAHCEGASFVPLMKDPKRPWKSAAFSQWPRAGKVGYAMRTDRYRLVRWKNAKTGEITATELYDHQADPKENVNIAGQAENAALINKLSAQLDAGWKAARPK